MRCGKTLKGTVIKMKQPLIGVTPIWDANKDSIWMLPEYLTGIIDSGGVPVILPLTCDPGILAQLLSTVDGLLFTGGPDISPDMYGEERLELTDKPFKERDEMEKLLFLQALERGTPVFGICRGLQIMNVILGGSLYQDIPSQFGTQTSHQQKKPYDAPHHTVEILEGTPLHALLGVDSLLVNSRHHQAICNLASAFSPMAKAPDGLVEAIFIPDKPFVRAIQWHPEHSPKDTASKALFYDFVEACRQ